MTNKVGLFFVGVVLGAAVGASAVLLLPIRREQRTAYVLRSPMRVRDRENVLTIPNGTVLYGEGALSQSAEIGNQLCLRITIPPEETGKLTPSDPETGRHGSYFVESK
jgi:hypothetical protein